MLLSWAQVKPERRNSTVFSSIPVSEDARHSYERQEMKENLAPDHIHTSIKDSPQPCLIEKEWILKFLFTELSAFILVSLSYGCQHFQTTQPWLLICKITLMKARFLVLVSRCYSRSMWELKAHTWESLKVEGIVVKNIATAGKMALRMRLLLSSTRFMRTLMSSVLSSSVKNIYRWEKTS